MSSRAGAVWVRLALLRCKSAGGTESARAYIHACIHPYIRMYVRVYIVYIHAHIHTYTRTYVHDYSNMAHLTARGAKKSSRPSSKARRPTTGISAPVSCPRKASFFFYHATQPECPANDWDRRASIFFNKKNYHTRMCSLTRN